MVASMVRPVIMKKNEIENFCLGDILFDYFKTPFFRPKMIASHLGIRPEEYPTKFVKADPQIKVVREDVSSIGKIRLETGVADGLG